MNELHVRHEGKVVGDNRHYRVSRRGRRPMYTDPSYKAFKQVLFCEIRRGMGTCPPWPYPFKGPVELQVRCWVHPRVDPANLLKPIQDSLQEAGAVRNDNQIRRSTAERAGVCRGGRASRLELVLREVEP
jgi:Holliday junction resolvase RusA-like endonuclease